MSVLDSPDVFRPPTFKTRVMGWFMRRMPFLFRLARRAWPIPKVGGRVAVTRYDDVRDVYLNDRAFGVPYKENLDVIMGNEPFFLSMEDTPAYHAGRDAMLRVVRQEDIPARLAPAAEAMAEKIVAEAGGRLEVVDQLVRRVTFDLLGDYFGVPNPPNGDLRVWGTRLFEFQFASDGSKELLDAVKEIAPALRGHIDSEIARRRAAPDGKDDVLARCLALQAQGEPGYSDVEIRTALMGFIVGGPPQPPMVVPQALEQLLRRPDALAGAQKAARDGDDALLAGHVFEAMRFDPLAPAMPRVAIADAVVAAGTKRARTVEKGTAVMVAMSSAMMDERRLEAPDSFKPDRLPHEYIHFGYGHHTCFGIHINKIVLPLMLKPLLKRRNLRRAPGRAGHLRKQGPFATELHVVYD
ncbi:MAG TPA: cytochrome P450 [Allosphingosinicella sp.]|nr:cytochrome P450 [Allosphingosinicella sp.]